MKKENPISERRATNRGVPSSVGYLHFLADSSRVGVADFLAESPMVILMNPFTDAGTRLRGRLGAENYWGVQLEALDEVSKAIESYPAEMHAIVPRGAALEEAAHAGTDRPRLERGSEGIEAALLRAVAPRALVWLYASTHGSFEVFGPPDEIDSIAERMS